MARSLFYVSLNHSAVVLSLADLDYLKDYPVRSQFPLEAICVQLPVLGDLSLFNTPADFRMGISTITRSSRCTLVADLPEVKRADPISSLSASAEVVSFSVSVAGFLWRLLNFLRLFLSPCAGSSESESSPAVLAL